MRPVRLCCESGARGAVKNCCLNSILLPIWQTPYRLQIQPNHVISDLDCVITTLQGFAIGLKEASYLTNHPALVHRNRVSSRRESTTSRCQ